MKKGFSPRLAVGFLILALCLITERFVTVIPDIFAEILYGVSALLILSGWFSFLFYPAKTRQITDGLYAVKTLLVSFFVMESSGSYIVFDTGVNPFLAGLGLKKLGINKDEVSHVFLTHSDYDHIGGLGLYKNAEVYISAEKKRLGSIHALNDRDVVNVNKDSIQIIFSPGHTDDSACYLINGKILVAGDTLRISCDKRFVPFLPFQNRNHAQNKASLQMLTDEGFLEKSELVLSAHTGFVKKEAGL